MVVGHVSITVTVGFYKRAQLLGKARPFHDLDAHPSISDFHPIRVTKSSILLASLGVPFERNASYSTRDDAMATWRKNPRRLHRSKGSLMVKFQAFGTGKVLGRVC